MADNLKQILISHEQPDFKDKMQCLRAVICQAIFGALTDEGKTVAKIIENVWKNKDKAVIEYTEKFDGVKLTPDQLRISLEDLKKAHDEIDPDLLKTIKQSIANVKKYQQDIFAGRSIPGKIKYTPIKRVGLCVPGASAPLPSTVIMTAVPAQVAGVKEIAVVSPPRHKGSIHPVILAVCHELGITEIYRIGGAQAVAALADGTPNIKKVDMIVGPGNRWVQTAKGMVFGQVGIDSIAGPSEVLIIADDNANPAWVAADMLSQAEHAPGSAILITDSKKLADSALAELKKQVEKLDRSKETLDCLIKYSGIVVCGSLDNAVEWANEFATEHLQIQCGDKSKDIADKIENAGAIFIGPYSPVALGDYWAGPSHTLPTGMSARFSSALSSNDFVKSSSIVEYSKDQLAKSADDIIRLASTEGLDAHAKSVKIRQKN
ncbi:MAG: histidinol dehydrogenase [Sedimentisphaerales bacterium]|nr:histidinol dehydrogenase [Sedimentisphaerales bacterium]